MEKNINAVISLRDNFSSVINKANDNIKEFKKQIQSTKDSIKVVKDGISGAFGGVASKVGGVIDKLGIKDIAKKSIMLASDMSDAQGVIDTVFMKSSQTMNQFAVSAIKDFGLSEMQAKQFSGTMGSLLSSSGVSGDELANMSTSLVGLSADFASLYNIDPAQAFEKVKKAMEGTSDSLSSFNIDMSDNALKAFALAQAYDKPWEAMSNMEKTQVRYNYLMKEGASANGSFKKSSGNIKSQLGIIHNEIDSLGAKVASGVVPVIVKGMEVCSGYIDKLIPIGEKVGTSISNLAKDLTDPFMETVNSIWEFLKGRIGEVSGLFQGISINDVFDGLKDVLTEILNSIKGVFDFFNNNWSIIEPIIIGVVGALVIFKGVMWAIDAVETVYIALMLLSDVVTKGFGATIKNVVGLATSSCGILFIVVAAIIAIGFLIWKNWDWIMKKATELCNWIGNKFTEMKNAVVGTISGWISVAVSLFNQFKAFIGSIWQAIVDFAVNIWLGFVNIIMGIWNIIINSAMYVYNGVKSAFLKMLEIVWIVLFPFRLAFEMIFKLMLSVVIIVGYKIYNAVKWAFDQIYSTVCGIMQIVGAYIITIWNFIITTVSTILTNIITVVIMIWTTVYNFIAQILTNVWSFILMIWTSIYNSLVMVFTLIWTYIVTIWTIIYTSIASVMTIIWTCIVDIWNSIYLSISGVLTSIWTDILGIWTLIYGDVSGAVTNIWNCIVEGFTNAKDGIVNIFTGVKDTIMSIFEGIWDGIKSILNIGIDMINGFIDGINGTIKLANEVPGVNIPAIDQIPRFALGTSYFNGEGMALVGEHGPELINMGRGCSVTTANDTKKALGGQNVNVYVTVQGNVIGNEEYMDQTGQYLANRILLAMQR